MGIFSRPKVNSYVTVKGRGNKSEAEIVVRLMKAGMVYCVPVGRTVDTTLLSRMGMGNSGECSVKLLGLRPMEQ